MRIKRHANTGDEPGAAIDAILRPTGLLELFDVASLHMDGFRRLQPGQRPGLENDHGFVHHNSGIHNKAAYNVYQQPVFSWREVVQLFYLTLTLRLHETSGFTDSLAGMLESCQVLFRSSPDLPDRLTAIRTAFGDVGIEQ